VLIHSLGVLLVPHHSVHTAEGIPAQTVEIRMLAVTYVMLCPRMYVCACPVFVPTPGAYNIIHYTFLHRRAYIVCGQECCVCTTL